MRRLAQWNVESRRHHADDDAIVVVYADGPADNSAIAIEVTHPQPVAENHNFAMARLVLATLPKGAIHVSSSTISVALAERLTAEHSKRGQQFISAPVFGRPEAAAETKLFILPAGPRSAIEVAAPLFQAVAQKTIIVSDMPKAANLVKLSGNFLITSVIEALGEAMALVRKLGIDSHQYVDILTSTLFGAPVYKTYGKLIADGKFEPAGFAATLGEKDIRLTLAAGESLRVPLPIASLVRDRFLTLLANGGDTLDWSAIGGLPARDAGLPPK